MPCGMMTGMHGSGGKTQGKMPCTMTTPDCVKKMVCLQTIALPERAGFDVRPVTFSAVTYRVSASMHPGLTPEPELSPPLAA